MGCGTSFVKYVLFFFNLLFALGGLAILGLGVATLLKLKEVTDIVPSKYEVAPWLFVIIGVVVFVIAFFGCCGAVREGHCMLVSYAVFLLVIIIIQVVLAILVFVYVDDAEKFLNNILWSSFKKAQGNTPDPNANLAKEAYNTLEVQFHCCGVNSAIDYGAGTLPASCCSDQNGIIQRLSGSCTVLEMGGRPGCLEALTNFAKTYGKMSAWIAIGVAGVEIVGAIFALCLANSIRNMERRSRY